MIVSLSNPWKKEGSVSRIFRFNGESIEGFPMMFVDKDSYIVSLQDECGLGYSSENVYNVHVGKYCAIAHEVTLVIDINHNYKRVCVGNISLPPESVQDLLHAPVLKRKGQILIQNDVWIGRGVTIMGGVTIHNGAVVAAGSVVTKDVEPYSIVGGNPARIIKYRFDREVILKLLSIQWWNWTEQAIQKNARWFSCDIVDFVNQFYEPPASDVPKCTNLNIEKSRRQFIYFADFEEGKYATWERVILEFCRAFCDREDCGLIIFLRQGLEMAEQYQKIMDLTEALDAKCSLYIFAGDDNDVEAVFELADYYITARNQQTIYYSCLADMYGVQMISGVDVPLFDDPLQY